MCGHGIADVEEVAGELAVGADDESFAAVRRADHAGDQPAVVRIAAAEQVAAPRDAHRQAVADRVHTADEVDATLRDVERVHAFERVRLRARQVGRRAVGLVRGGDDHLANLRVPRRLEHVPRAGDIGFKGADRIGLRHADNGLRGEVEHGRDVVLG